MTIELIDFGDFLETKFGSVLVSISRTGLEFFDQFEGQVKDRIWKGCIE